MAENIAWHWVTAQPCGADPPLAPVSGEIKDVLAELDAVVRQSSGRFAASNSAGILWQTEMKTLEKIVSRLADTPPANALIHLDEGGLDFCKIT